MPKKNKNATIKDLAKSISKKKNLDQKKAEAILNSIFDEIKEQIIVGNKVNIAGFGSFELTKWKDSPVYDPNTKTKVKRQIHTAYFNPSRKLKEEVKEF